MWILITDVAVGSRLVNLALEEVSLDVAVRGRMAAKFLICHSHNHSFFVCLFINNLSSGTKIEISSPPHSEPSIGKYFHS